MVTKQHTDSFRESMLHPLMNAVMTLLKGYARRTIYRLQYCLGLLCTQISQPCGGLRIEKEANTVRTP
jgi:hypothetical protein